MNDLQKTINLLIQTGQEYNDVGSDSFGDINGTKFEGEFKPCLEACGFESVEPDSEGKRVSAECFTTKTHLKAILKRPTNDDLWVVLEQDFIRAYQDKNIYIPQPAGSGHEPDFLVYCNRRLFLIELKKSENRKPTYGDNGCHPKVIYIFKGKRSKKFGGGLGHTYWYGGDIIDAKVYEEGLDERAKMKAKIKQMLESAVHVNGYTRMGTNQKLGDNVRILEHPKQREFERSVITLISGPPREDLERANRLWKQHA